MGRDVISDGFEVDRCEKCGIHNDEIGGVMMQCSKCKNAYYCSMKCFNEDMERHLKFCNTGELMVDNHHRKPYGDKKREEEEEQRRKEKAAATEAKRKAKARAPRTVNVEMPDGEVISIPVLPGDTDKELKKKIKGETGMETKRQVLHKDDEEWPKGKSCREMGVKPSDTLRVTIRKVPITVTPPDDDSQPIHLSVDPYEPLQTIKDDLEGRTNIPAVAQALHMDRKLLDDNDTPCRDYGIEAGSVLDLEPTTIVVIIEMPDGASFSLQLQPRNDTVDDIKEQIEQKIGVSPGLQILSHEGMVLPGKTTCRDMGLKDKSVLQCNLAEFPVTVNTPDGPVEVMVSPSKLLSHIKGDLEGLTGISPNNQQLSMDGKELVGDTTIAVDHGIAPGTVLDLEPKTITVSVDMPDGSQVQVNISPNDKSDDIKEQIQSQTGMPVSHQVLKKDGRELPNQKSAKDMGLKEGSKLTVDETEFPVTVNAPDGPVEVMVSPSKPLSDIKDDLEGLTGISPNNQQLSMDGKELVGDTMIAGDHGITAGKVLDLEPKTITVSVDMPDGSQVQVNISPNDKNDDIKEQIQSQTGMPVSHQVLKKDGRELPNQKSTKDMGLKEGSKLTVDETEFPVTVNAPDGPVEVMVKTSKPLSDIKDDLEGLTGISPNNQQLSMDGKELIGDTMSAGDHGITPGKVLDLDSLEISIELPDGSEMSVNISLEDVEKLQQAAERIDESSSDDESSKSEDSTFKFKSKDYNGRPWTYSLDEANRKRDNAFNWFHRMGRPDKKSMERQVKKLNLPDITAADVQLLPWVWGGRSLDVEKMKALHDKDFVDIKRRLQRVEDSYHKASD